VDSEPIVLFMQNVGYCRKAWLFYKVNSYYLQMILDVIKHLENADVEM